MSSAAALAWARDRVGIHEVPFGSNKGPLITQWEVDSGYPWVVNVREGVSWCQCFANAVAHAGGAPLIKDGYTPNFLSGRYRDHGYEPIPLTQAQPGDFIYYKWPGVSHDLCDHVGVLDELLASIVRDIEGNTSGTDAGSQNNGGGVYLRERSRLLVAGAVHVPYPERIAYRTLRDGVRGGDVRAFQKAVNQRADGCGRKDRRVTVDGEVGPETLVDGAWAAWILGVGDSTAANRSGGISPYVQKLVLDPDKRNQTQKERAGHRREVAGCK